jgi:lipoprotein-anchoring transpeptidase ErfK/SrfK
MASPKLRLTPKMIVIDREDFQLILYRLKMPGYVVEMRRQIAVGAVGHKTPPGMYFVDAKNKRPDWKAPNSDWVPKAKRGKIIPYADPDNPFRGGFISFANSDGVGIHGTKFDPALGTRASHGCIRVTVDTVQALMGKVSLGTPVFIY